jgi:hypothetical protein
MHPNKSRPGAKPPLLFDKSSQFVPIDMHQQLGPVQQIISQKAAPGPETLTAFASPLSPKPQAQTTEVATYPSNHSYCQMQHS